MGGRQQSYTHRGGTGVEGGVTWAGKVGKPMDHHHHHDPTSCRASQHSHGRNPMGRSLVSCDAVRMRGTTPPQSPVDATLREYLSPGAVRSAASAAGSREGNVSAAGDSSVQSKGTLLVVLGRQSFTEGERNGGSWTCTKHGNRRRQSACRTSGSGGDLLAPSVSCLGGRKRPMIRASKTRLNNDRTVPLVTPPFPDTEGDWLVTAGTRGRKP